jgi:hypothetical protein
MFSIADALTPFMASWLDGRLQILLGDLRWWIFSPLTMCLPQVTFVNS